jgi:hypothetical protein
MKQTTDLDRALDRLRKAYIKRKRVRFPKSPKTTRVPTPTTRLPYNDGDSRHVWNDGDPVGSLD